MVVVVAVLGSVGLAEYYGSSAKFFPLFSVVRFSNAHCLGNNNLNGTCFTRRECTRYGGLASGTCGNGLGVCCVVQKSCGTTSNVNCTYFVNPGFPGFYTGGSRCTISINKCNNNVCQVRLDFLDFSLAQPDVNGNCLNDFLSVTGGATSVPRICGENTGQHIYVDFDPGSNPIQISIDTNTAFAFNRRWNIKITQIPCCSNELVLTGTREMANLNYGVCVRMAPGYCSIEWSQDPNNIYSFTVSGDTEGVGNLVGTATAADSGANCTGDFIVIPNPSQNGVALDTDRFCGNALVTTTTSSKPFVLTVVTNSSENFGDGVTLPDVANRGFCLQYRQLPCPP
ncbi:cubilin isoform X2 [Anabrus simplex]|uniref:cubilin isoform X2 n=1 Tax=Anabrus simplex TaxID=316456 RepID=UPI0034DD159E